MGNTPTKTENDTERKKSNFFGAGLAAMTSNDETWATPRNLYAKLAIEFNFTLDAAALSGSTLVRSNWYGPDHVDESRRDALVREWAKDAGDGVVWLNPPYGRAMGKWMNKCSVETAKGATIVTLVPARTDTAWWHDNCIEQEVRFIRGRLKFGGFATAAPFPSAIVVFRPEKK